MSSSNLDNPLKTIQDWYYSCCDGFWEHGTGIQISTLDNPGWMIDINLEATSLESINVPRTKVERNENDWIHYWTADKRFHARCGPKNLIEALELFVTLFSLGKK